MNSSRSDDGQGGGIDKAAGDYVIDYAVRRCIYSGAVL